MFSIHQANETLEKYYRGNLQGKEHFRISDLTYIGEGISNYMYSFHLEYVESAERHSESLILRVGKNEASLHREFQALKKLYPTPIPVPKVYDMGEAIPGFSFIIMEKVEGQVMSSAMNWITDAERDDLWKQFSRTLAAINMLDWRSIGFGFLDPPDVEYAYINRQISMLREWCKSLEIHCLFPILDWLEANKQPSDHYVLLHGDYHPGNVIVNKGKIAAIVDWEDVSIGDAAYDVCWPPLFLRAINLPDEARIIATEMFLESYSGMTGRELRNFDFYLIIKAVLFLFFILAVKTHGIDKLELKTEMEILMHPEFKLLGCCIDIVKESTGIDIFTGG